MERPTIAFFPHTKRGGERICEVRPAAPARFAGADSVGALIDSSVLIARKAPRDGRRLMAE